MDDTALFCDTKYWDATILQQDTNDGKFATVRQFFIDYLRLREEYDGNVYKYDDNRDINKARCFYDDVRRAALRAGLNHVVCIAATCKFPYGKAQIQYAVRKTRGAVCKSWLGRYGTIPQIGIQIEIDTDSEMDYVDPERSVGFTEDIGVLADEIRRAAGCFGDTPLQQFDI